MGRKQGGKGGKQKGRVMMVPVESLKLGPRRREKLESEQEARVARAAEVFREVYDLDVDGFLRDLHPEREIAIWERMAEDYKAKTQGATLDQKKAIFRDLVAASCGAT